MVISTFGPRGQLIAVVFWIVFLAVRVFVARGKVREIGQEGPTESFTGSG